MRYRILTEGSEKLLEERVNLDIAYDWIPQGGVAIVIVGSTIYYSQAMIKTK